MFSNHCLTEAELNKLVARNLPASDPIQGTLPVSNALEDIVARERRKRSAPRCYADSQHRDSEIVAFQRNVRRNSVPGKCHQLFSFCYSDKMLEKTNFCT